MKRFALGFILPPVGPIAGVVAGIAGVLAYLAYRAEAWREFWAIVGSAIFLFMFLAIMGGAIFARRHPEQEPEIQLPDYLSAQSRAVLSAAVDRAQGQHAGHLGQPVLLSVFSRQDATVRSVLNLLGATDPVIKDAEGDFAKRNIVPLFVDRAQLIQSGQHLLEAAKRRYADRVGSEQVEPVHILLAMTEGRENVLAPYTPEDVEFAMEARILTVSELEQKRAQLEQEERELREKLAVTGRRLDIVNRGIRLQPNGVIHSVLAPPPY
ncbi:MAG: hypothetical protein Q8P39_00285 [Candidatus Yanofskybacteria bacterium]|nr:hypothetical protein [Candidatus Yanofskybacteria bacterium]